MDYSQVDFSGIYNAAGITEEESSMLRQLVAVFNDRLLANLTRMKYYEDKNELRNIGLTIPPDIARKVDTRVGWAAKAVDYLAARSTFDGFTSAGGIDEELATIVRQNELDVEYSKALPTMLVHGVGFWTVSRGAAGEPKAVINYHNATSAAAIWDYRHKRVKCAFVVEDYELVSVNGREEYRPSFVVLHTDKAVLEIQRFGSNRWETVRKPHSQGRCLLVPMAYRPQDTKPFGKSRVSRPVMSITDEMQREILRASLHAEVFSSGQKAVLGASDEQYDRLAANKYRAAVSELFVMTRDENGELPQLSNFPQQSMEPHIKAMELLMSRMAAETSVPVAAYGLSSNGYTSSDALRASSDDLILEAENLNRNTGRALVEVAMLALAIANNTTFAKLVNGGTAISVHWRNPAMPSIAAQTDAMTKQAQVCDWLPETSVYWEELGYSEDQRDRILAEKAQAKRQTTLSQMMFRATEQGGE